MAHADGYLPLHREMRMFGLGPIVFLQPTVASGEEQPAALTVELNNGVVGLADGNGLASGFGKVETVYGVIGMIKMIGGSALAVITAREKVAQLRGEDVYRITGVKVIKSKHDTVKDDGRYMSLFEHGLNPNGAGNGLYFSYGADLTLSQQRFAAKSADHSAAGKPLYLRADQNFLFNRHLIEPLTESEASHVVRFVLPVVQGFVEAIPMRVGQSEGHLTLIARRRIQRPGVRHWRRGCDPQGAVANFVETEQLVVLSDGKDTVTSSFVQVRGSIPLLWSQIPNIKYKPTTHIAPPSSYEPVFDRHIADLVDQYQEVVAINLANQHGSEGLLGQKMAEQAERFSQNNPGLRLVPFDFHKECGTSRYDRLDLLWELISGDVARLGYYLEAPGLSLSLRQKGVIRTNCIDCLDRTNVVQGWLARKQLEALLTRLSILPATSSLADAFPVGNHLMAEREQADHAFEIVVKTVAEGVQVDCAFKVIWADHGDAVSRQYAGTGALKSGFTRTGKRTLGGLIDDGVKSLTRYYLNNFEDGKKQDAYDLVSGTYPLSKEKPSPFKSHTALWPLATVILVLAAFSYTLWRAPRQAGVWFNLALLPSAATVALLWYVVKNGKKFVLKPQLCPSLAQPW